MSSSSLQGKEEVEPSVPAPPEIFPADEEKQLLEESNTEKTLANKTFTSGNYSGAIQGYEKALAVCPNYFEYDIAVLRSNIAACHIKLTEWKQAIDSATKALESLDRLDPPPPALDTTENKEKTGSGHVSEVDDSTEILLAAHTRASHTFDQIHKLRTKALLRRAHARHSLGGWASLQGALEDYTALSKPPNELSSLDQKAVIAALKKLPDQLEQAKNEEMAEMMGKLKNLGNGLLKPFGLSTDMFKFEKGEGGGYSMNFDQSAGKGK